MIFQNKIKNLEKAALIADIADPVIKQQAIDCCIAGATLKQLKQMAKQENHKIFSIATIRKRGRQTNTVNFGNTKNLKVAKTMIESLLNHEDLNLTSPIMKKNIDWTNPRALSDTYKQLLNTLEKLHS